MHTILLIEDNLELLDNTAEILKLANYNVIKADNGKVGIELMRENIKDLSLILCDIMMPVLDGYGVLRAYENIPEIQNIPFVFISAKSEKTDIRAGMDLGADEYLTKPFTGNELLSLITSRINKAQKIKAIGNKTLKELDYIMNDNDSFEKSEIFSSKFHVKKMRKREFLFIEGDATEFLYYVVEGKVKAIKTNETGKEYITNIFSNGDFIGYSGILDNGKHENTVLTMEDSKIATLAKKDFFDILQSSNETCIKFIKHLSSMLNDAEDKLPKLAYQSARKKVAEALIFISKKYKQETEKNISFEFSRDDLSSISGISPESVSRNLTDFKNENLIKIQNGKISILNSEKLSNLKN